MSLWQIPFSLKEFTYQSKRDIKSSSQGQSFFEDWLSKAKEDVDKEEDVEVVVAKEEEEEAILVIQTMKKEAIHLQETNEE